MESSSDAQNTTEYINSAYNMTKEDSNWIISNAFIILTMQTGKTINI